MVTAAERAVVERDALLTARRLYRVRGRHIPHIELADLEQIARIAAWDAEGRWEPEKGTFRSFANDRIRGAVLHYIRDRSEIPRPIWDKRKPFEEWTKTPLSLDAWAPGTDDERIRIADQVGGVADDYTEIEWLAVVARLPGRLVVLIMKRFWERMTQSEIAKVLGLSPMQISRLGRQALRRLREMLTEEHDG